MAKPMQTIMTDLNRLTKDTRLYPRGRMLASLLKVAFNPKIEKRYRDLAEAVIIATFVRKGGIDISEDLPTNIAEKAPHTKIETEAASNMKNMLAHMISGGVLNVGEPNGTAEPAATSDSATEHQDTGSSGS